jgi:hypothetical protein
MLQLALLVRKSTLSAIAEHSIADLSGAVDINDRESIVLLDAEVVRRILDLARPDDERIDEVILRMVL